MVFVFLVCAVCVLIIISIFMYPTSRQKVTILFLIRLFVPKLNTWWECILFNFCRRSTELGCACAWRRKLQKKTGNVILKFGMFLIPVDIVVVGVVAIFKCWYALLTAIKWGEGNFKICSCASWKWYATHVFIVCATNESNICTELWSTTIEWQTVTHRMQIIINIVGEKRITHTQNANGKWQKIRKEVIQVYFGPKRPCTLLHRERLPF